VRRKEHADIWGLLEEQIKELPDRSLLEVLKVEAHLTEQDVELGKIDREEWEMNGCVDEAAKRAGKVRRPPGELIDGLQRRTGCTVLVQRMFVDILVERHEHLKRLEKRFPVGDSNGQLEYERYLVGELVLEEDKLDGEGEGQSQGEEQGSGTSRWMPRAELLAAVERPAAQPRRLRPISVEAGWPTFQISDQGGVEAAQAFFFGPREDPFGDPDDSHEGWMNGEVELWENDWEKILEEEERIGNPEDLLLEGAWGDPDDEDVPEEWVPRLASPLVLEEDMEPSVRGQAEALSVRERRVLGEAKQARKLQEAICLAKKRALRFTQQTLPRGVRRVEHPGENGDSTLEEGTASTPSLLQESGVPEELRECFPGYPWLDPKGPLFRVELPKPPKVLGRTKKENAVDRKSTVMSAGVHLFHPMRWYLQSLRWSPPGPVHKGTTNAELALDFEAATGVPLLPPGVTGARTLRQKAVLFREAARRTAELAGGPPTPGLAMKYCHAMTLMRWPETTGWECRAHLLCGDVVKQTLAACRADRLNVMQQGAAAYDVHCKWARSPGTPLWKGQKQQEPVVHRGRGIVSCGFTAKVLKHNQAEQLGRHSLRLEVNGKELMCCRCGLWAPVRFFSAFTKELCGTREERAAAAPPVGADKRQRKLWWSEATYLRHARRDAGKEGGTVVRKQKKVPVGAQSGPVGPETLGSPQVGGNHEVDMQEEEEEEEQLKGAGGVEPCTAGGGVPRRRRRRKEAAEVCGARGRSSADVAEESEDSEEQPLGKGRKRRRRVVASPRRRSPDEKKGGLQGKRERGAGLVCAGSGSPRMNASSPGAVALARRVGVADAYNLDADAGGVTPARRRRLRGKRGVRGPSSGRPPDEVSGWERVGALPPE
jgi:hypothetical protein